MSSVPKKADKLNLSLSLLTIMAKNITHKTLNLQYHNTNTYNDNTNIDTY